LYIVHKLHQIFGAYAYRMLFSSLQRVAPKILPVSPKPSQETNATATNDEKVTELSRQLQESRSQRVREQNKLSEVTQQLNTVLHENTVLEEQLAELRNKVQDIKTLQDEINTLEEVRYVSFHVVAYFFYFFILFVFFNVDHRF